MEGKKGRNSVFGIFSDQNSLNRAVDILKTQNFRNSDISVLMPSKEGTKDFAIEKNTKAPEGATAGAATGAVAGGVFGWLVGAGALAIPGLGPFIAAGPIMAAIAGAGVGGTVGGIAGGLIGLGIPEFEAERYEGYVKEGGMLISIHVDDAKWEARAKDILEENGAKNIATTSEKKSGEPYFRSRAEQEFEDTTHSHT
ncbi:MAG: quinol:electron acceptor oxidoreductase subunit ActD [Bacteriovorax sp.]